MKVLSPRIPRNMGYIITPKFMRVVGSHNIRCIQTCHISSVANIKKPSLHLPFVQFRRFKPLEVDWNPMTFNIMRVLPLPSLNKTIKTFLKTPMYHEAHASSSSSSSSSSINGWPSYPTPLKCQATPLNNPTLTQRFLPYLPWMPVEVICQACPFLEPEMVAVPSPWGAKKNRPRTGRIGHKYDCCKRERPSQDLHGANILPYTRIIKMHLSQVNLNT